jgi:hypothetical protein
MQLVIRWSGLRSGTPSSRELPYMTIDPPLESDLTLAICDKEINVTSLSFDPRMFECVSILKKSSMKMLLPNYITGVEKFCTFIILTL